MPKLFADQFDLLTRPISMWYSCDAAAPVMRNYRKYITTDRIGLFNSGTL